MEKTADAANAVKKAIETLNEMPDSKKRDALVRKLTVVYASLQSDLTKETILGTLPVHTRKKKGE